MAPRVLIVEDNLVLAQAMARLLTRLQVEADVSGDGIEGLQKYAASPYDLLVVDLHLPQLSGVELVRKIRSTARGKTLPVIIVTGVYKGEQYAKKARESLAVNYYLEKPFSQEALLEAVRQSLPTAAPAAAPAPARRPAAAPAATASSTPPSSSPTAPAPAAEAEPKVKVMMARDQAAEAPEPSPATEPITVGKPAAPRSTRPAPPASRPRQVAEIQPRRALQGNLLYRPLDLLLLEAQKTRATGILFVKKGDDDRSVLFINGVPIGLSTAKLETSFGNWLFNQGKISLMEYQVYQGQHKNGADLDQIFIKMGALLPDEFYAQWKTFVEESLIQMFGWQEADFTFQLWPPLPESSPLSPLNVAHVIHQGFKRFVAAERVTQIRRLAAGRFVALAKGFYDHQMHIRIEPLEAVFLDRADGTRRLEELVTGTEEEQERLERSFAAFQTLGMVELKDQPGESEVEAPYPIRERVFPSPAPEEAEPESEEEAPAESVEPPEAKAHGFDDMVGDLEKTLTDVVEEMPAAAAQAPAPDQEQAAREAELAAFHQSLSAKNYYEIFGLKFGNFDFAKLKEQYFKLTKQFSPEQFIMSSGEYLEKSEQVLSAVATAYNTLSNVVSKEKYDEMLDSRTRAAGVPGAKDQDKMQAEVSFQSGMAFLEMGDWDGAEKSLAEAMALAPQNAEIIAQYAYAFYNKNRKSKVVQKRVQELLAQALKIKPKCAPAFAYRGALLLDDDKVALAEADFKKALSLNPRYRFALKGLKKIEQRQQDEKKGLFARFRK